VVLNADLLHMPEDEIPSTRILSTWIRGEEVFSNKEFR
jgi:predicted amidohydrolase YtcJ